MGDPISATHDLRTIQQIRHKVLPAHQAYGRAVPRQTQVRNIGHGIHRQAKQIRGKAALHACQAGYANTLKAGWSLVVLRHGEVL